MTRLYTFAPNIEYIKKKRGEYGLQKLMDELKNRGRPIDLRRIKKSDWVPLDTRKVFLETIRDVFGWDAERIREMGRNAPRLSHSMKIYFGVYLTADQAFAEAPSMWKKHYSAGELLTTDFDGGTGKLVLRNFDLDPLFCVYLEGYLQGVGDLTKSKNVRVKETRCTFRGDAVHEYTVTWE
jgi:hypothetical protein